MNINYSDEQIKKMYLEENLSYREIVKKTGACSTRINSIVGGLRSRSDTLKMRYKTGKIIRSEETRLKMSANGKRAAQRSGKCWTKPERAFVEILNEINVKVIFPEFLIELFGINPKDFENPDMTLNFQYPLQRYILDFACPELKVNFSVQGDYWHANPSLYDPMKLGKIQQHNVRHDKCRRVYLESIGWTTCELWESEISWNKELVINKIKSYINHDFKRSDVVDQNWEEDLKKLWFKEKKPRKIVEKKKGKCRICEKYFERYRDGKYCSQTCASIGSQKAKRPDIETLKKEIEDLGYSAVGRKYGVSDNAIRKWI